jgi:hypothetical protein
MSVRETALAALHARIVTAFPGRNPAPVVLRGETSRSASRRAVSWCCAMATP